MHILYEIALVPLSLIVGFIATQLIIVVPLVWLLDFDGERLTAGQRAAAAHKTKWPMLIVFVASTAAFWNWLR